MQCNQLWSINICIYSYSSGPPTPPISTGPECLPYRPQLLFVWPLCSLVNFSGCPSRSRWDCLFGAHSKMSNSVRPQQMPIVTFDLLIGQSKNLIGMISLLQVTVFTDQPILAWAHRLILCSIQGGMITFLDFVGWWKLWREYQIYSGEDCLSHHFLSDYIVMCHSVTAFNIYFKRLDKQQCWFEQKTFDQIYHFLGHPLYKSSPGASCVTHQMRPTFFTFPLNPILTKLDGNLPGWVRR